MRYLILVITLFSCQKEFDTLTHRHRWVEYTIPKGDHKSSYDVAQFTGTELKFKCVFDNSAIYNLNNTNQGDINKLYGFTYELNPHINSARFGWNYDIASQKIRIYAYTYINKVRSFHLITSIELNREYEYSILLSNRGYSFIIDNKIYEVQAERVVGTAWYLYSYFGGDETAPHDITIRIKEISN